MYNHTYLEGITSIWIYWSMENHVLHVSKRAHCIKHESWSILAIYVHNGVTLFVTTLNLHRCLHPGLLITFRIRWCRWQAHGPRWRPLEVPNREHELMQAAFDICHGAFSSKKICSLSFLLVGLVRSRGWGYCGSKDCSEVIFNACKANGIFNWGVSGLIWNVGNTSQAIIMTPCMSFHNVAMEVC